MTINRSMRLKIIPILRCDRLVLPFGINILPDSTVNGKVLMGQAGNLFLKGFKARLVVVRLDIKRVVLLLGYNFQILINIDNSTKSTLNKIILIDSR